MTKKKKRTPTKHSAIHRDLMSNKYRQRVKPNKKRKFKNQEKEKDYD